MTLRERKKLRTRAAISEAAISLFVEHGFDQVSITQVAEAADVSRRTLFAYFPTKEDLVVHRFADHEDEPARVVRARPAGQSPLAALHEHYLDALRARDPVTGLTDVPEVLSLYHLLRSTPQLMARMLQFNESSETQLAAALHETADTAELPARLAAAQIVSVQWTLSMANYERAVAGTRADDAYPAAAAAANQAFDLLTGGLGGLWAVAPRLDA
ncbi:TetR family transcriptional regulator [Kribbella speibonae]|uniref:TetR family transcriptional regulator n=1 Tax=Kribbella speibonae TaxID=1572660 RepID=A0ABY1ZWJ1_9ACTN|nr:TetR family transcriptional regulator [Kribbella speibonae]TCC16623.1 TetR family transcriptional regulator [Kribbella speibonae]